MATLTSTPGAANPREIASDPSVDPLSTSTSRNGTVCLVSAASVRGRKSASL